MHHERTRYRIYDRRWRPLTPLLELPVSLTPSRGLQRGFLAEATLDQADGNGFAFHTWVVIGHDGIPAAATLVRTARGLRRGDEVVFPNEGGLRAYRPSTRQVFPINDGGEKFPGPPDNAGMYCNAPDRTLSPQATYWSTDGGRSWARMHLAEVLRSTTGPADILGCQVRAGRLTVVTGESAENRSDRVVTVALRGERTVRSYRLDRRTIGPVFQALPDGRIVFPAHRPGFMVATTPANAGFEFRRAPTGLFPEFSTVGHDIVVIAYPPARHQLIVSRDAGHTWRTIDLRGRGWEAPS
jgi:hypothetical protein